MAEHDDFDRQFVAVTPEEPEQLEDSDERQVQEGQRHGPASSLSLTPTKVQLNGPDDILGTHRSARLSSSPRGPGRHLPSPRRHDETRCRHLGTRCRLGYERPCAQGGTRTVGHLQCPRAGTLG